MGPRVTLRTTFAGATYEWGGRVVRTESEIDPVSRMVHAIVEVRDPYLVGPDPERPPLAVGMYVEAEIEGRAFERVAVLPRAALRGRNQVLLVDIDNHVRFREIDVLRSTTDSVYVSSGLSEGEMVALTALEGPTDGMLVQITDVSVNGFAGGISESGVEVGTAASETESQAESVIADSTTESLTEPVVATATTDFSNEPDAAALTAEREQPGWLRDLLTEEPAPRETRTARARVARTSPLSSPASAPSVASAPSPASSPSPVAAVTPPAAVPALAPRRVPTQPTDNDPPVPDRTPVSAERAAPPVSLVPDRASAISVLAFVDMSPRTTPNSTDTLGEGVAEAVSAGLADLESVTLVSTPTDAGWLVGGGVQRLGDAVRITARVVDASDGDVVRAVKVDGPLADLPRIRDEVVAAIRNSVIEALGLSIPPSASGVLVSVALRDFANVSQAPADSELVRSITAAVAEQILSLQTVAVVATEDDADWIISGGVQRVGGVLRITASVIDVKQGAVVSAVKVDGPVEEITRLQEEVAGQLSSTVSQVTS